jgi:tRNA dimethylallyltransferase
VSQPEPSCEPPTLFFLVGPTAAGKSELAPHLARAGGAEILSLDSMLVYRGMDVGTAKPDSRLRAEVGHHLLDLVEPWESFSVQRYLAEARRVLAELEARGKRALFVGGTALYLKALTHGLFEGPPVDRELRSSLEREFEAAGGAALHSQLARIDAPSAARIHAHDKKRLVRALEVHRQTGRALSDWQREWRDGQRRAPGRPRRIVGLDAPMEELEARIRRRVHRSLDEGWIEEAVRIRAQGGFSPTAAQALGYAEVLQVADGALARETCEARIALATRQFARRQRTWFRQFPELEWIRPGSSGTGSSENRVNRGAPQASDPALLEDEVAACVRTLGW